MGLLDSGNFRVTRGYTRETARQTAAQELVRCNGGRATQWRNGRLHRSCTNLAVEITQGGARLTLGRHLPDQRLAINRLNAHRNPTIRRDAPSDPRLQIIVRQRLSELRSTARLQRDRRHFAAHQ
jgi:hypothetical protein